MTTKTQPLSRLEPSDYPTTDPLLLRSLTQFMERTFNELESVSLSEDVWCEIGQAIFQSGVATKVRLKKIKTSKGMFPLMSSDPIASYFVQPHPEAGFANVIIHFAKNRGSGTVAYAIFEEGLTATASAQYPYSLQPPWNSMALLNTWADINDGVNQNSGYYLDNQGTIHLRGTIKNGTAGAVLTTLPSGYRPTLRLLFRVRGFTGAAEVDMTLTVYPNGDIKDQAGTVGGAGANLSFDGITFDTR